MGSTCERLKKAISISLVFLHHPVGSHGRAHLGKVWHLGHLEDVDRRHETKGDLRAVALYSTSRLCA